MSGTFLIGLGAAWTEMGLSSRPTQRPTWTALYGTHENWIMAEQIASWKGSRGSAAVPPKD